MRYLLFALNACEKSKQTSPTKPPPDRFGLDHASNEDETFDSSEDLNKQVDSLLALVDGQGETSLTAYRKKCWDAAWGTLGTPPIKQQDLGGLLFKHIAKGGTFACCIIPSSRASPVPPAATPARTISLNPSCR